MSEQKRGETASKNVQTSHSIQMKDFKAWTFLHQVISSENAVFNNKVLSCQMGEGRTHSSQRRKETHRWRWSCRRGGCDAIGRSRMNWKLNVCY